MNNNTIVNNEKPNGRILDALSTVINGKTERVVIIGESMGNWSHGVFRVITCLEGQRLYNCIVDGREAKVNIKPGEIYFILPSGFFEPASNDASLSAFLSVAYFQDYIRSIILHCPRDGSRSDEDCYLHTANKLGEFGVAALELLRKTPKALENDLEIVLPLVKSVLSFTSRLIAENKDPVSSRKSSAIWLDMNRYLMDHSDTRSPRKELARIFNVTPNYISNLFKQYSGKSFSDVYMTCRLERAAAMLIGSRLSVKEIGAICGYNYTSHFIRQFHEKYGMPPTAYRNERVRAPTPSSCVPEPA